MVTTIERENPGSESTVHYEKPNYIPLQVF